MIKKTHIILYVADQERSTEFYRKLFEVEPILHVPGMTEFQLSDGCVMGLMPEAGIKRLLGDPLPDPTQANGIPRCELYLVVDDAEAYHRRALALGAKELSPLLPRDWGDRVAYSLDADGNVIAFAGKG